MNTPKIISYSDWVNNTIYNALEINLKNPHDIVPFNPEMIECKSCSGKGSTRCDTCNGEKLVDCNVCDAIGVDEDGNTCVSCMGRSNYICESCLGKGRHHCDECNGTGKIIPEEFEHLGLDMDDYESQKLEDLKKWINYHDQFRHTT